MGMVNKYSIIGMATAMLFAISCSKDEEDTEPTYNEYFTAHILPYGTPSPDKTYITTGETNDYGCWADGDAVNINGTERSVRVEEAGEHYTATIGADGIATANGGYLAAYPAAIVTVSGGTADFIIPETTYYSTVAAGAGAGHQSVEAPMTAYTEARNLQFENVTLLTRFALKTAGNATVQLQRIAVSCDRALNGIYSIRYNNGAWDHDASALSGTRRILLCPDGVTLGATEQPFHLFLPPVTEASAFTVDIYLTVDGVRRRFARSKSGSVSLSASRCYDFGTITYDASTQTLTDNNGNRYDEVEPAGTQTDPYLACNAAEWSHWCSRYATTSGKYFKLDGDFSVSDVIAEFRGTLDGDGHTVTLGGCALIAYLNGGTVKHVTTAGTVQNSQYYTGSRFTCGSIASYAQSATIRHCINTASITVVSAQSGTIDLGGIAGRIKTTTIDCCRNEAPVSTEYLNVTNFYAGGIAGCMDNTNSQIINCANRGAVATQGNGSDVSGGLIGYVGTNNQVYNSYSYANVSSNGKSAGLVGQLRTLSTVRNCYFYNNSSQHLCYSNAGTIGYCYHSSNNTVNENETNGTVANCQKLSSAVTIQGGSDGGLHTQLTNNIATMSLTNACTWRNNGTLTLLEWE
ncbi:MAG: hypothetical protein AUK63_206 [bacterium P3]|nr:MAG: hypothetical protein AUK63_206 [bacterium P3]KWW42332.1 MAG: hypothetical protein F083_236 [bacterium F083]